MIDREHLENELSGLSLEDLKEVSKIINKMKKTNDNREEFIDVLKRWREKFPNAKWFYTGGAWKGAYECSGEWGTDDWYDTDKMEELYELKDENPDDHGAVDILDEFDTFDDFKKALLNISLDGCNRDTRQMFEDEMTRSKHAPKHKLTDAEDLYSGEAMCEFINIETGEKKYLYYNAW